MNDDDWVSLHLFHHGDLDRLLAELVHPALGELKRQGAIRDAFFLRYWNGGPHLRLRLAPGEGVAAAALAERLVTALQPALDARAVGAPAASDYAERARVMERAEARAPPLAEPIEPLQPPDRIQRRRYRFDSARYGDAALRAIVEPHFCRSSALALATVRLTLEQLPSRLTLALHLAAAAPAALGLQPQPALELFSRLADVLGLFGVAAPAPAPELSTDERVGLAQQLRDGLPLVGQSDEVTRLVGWWQQELAQQAGLLRACGRPAELIVADFVHLLNNRLGFGVRTECMIYRWIAEALGAMNAGTAIAAGPS